jgi:hypothetical protein
MGSGRPITSKSGLKSAPVPDYETIVAIICIHEAVERTQCCAGNIAIKTGTPIKVAGCSRLSLTRSHTTSGTANTIAHSHQLGSQSG